MTAGVPSMSYGSGTATPIPPPTTTTTTTTTKHCGEPTRLPIPSRAHLRIGVPAGGNWRRSERMRRRIRWDTTRRPRGSFQHHHPTGASTRGLHGGTIGQGGRKRRRRRVRIDILHQNLRRGKRGGFGGGVGLGPFVTAARWGVWLGRRRWRVRCVGFSFRFRPSSSSWGGDGGGGGHGLLRQRWGHGFHHRGGRRAGRAIHGGVHTLLGGNGRKGGGKRRIFLYQLHGWS